MKNSELRSHIDALTEAISVATDKGEADGMRAERAGLYFRLKQQLDGPDTRGAGLSVHRAQGADPYAKAFDAYLRRGDTHGLESRVSAGLTTSPIEAGQTDPANAGYQVPQGFWRNLQVALRAYGGLAADFKQVDTPEHGRPMPWPTVDPTTVTAGVLGQDLTQLAVSSPYVFGQGILSAWTVVTNPILAAHQLITDSAFDVGEFVRERIAEQIGREIAALAVTGTGASQPLGIIPSLNSKGVLSGASGGFYQLTAATAVKTFAATNPTELAGNILSPTTLIGMIQGVDPAYYPNCKWYFNSTQAWNLRTVVDSSGRPLLNFVNGMDGVYGQEGSTNALDGGVASSEAPVNSPIGRLFGFDVIVDNSIPNLAASTTGGPVFGSMPHAMVKRNGPASVMVLRERYADFLAVGYIGYQRLDTRSNDLRAAVTVKPAAT